MAKNQILKEVKAAQAGIRLFFKCPSKKKKKLKLWRLPQNRRFHGKMECLPLWPTYIGEKGRTLGKTYGIGNTPWGTHWELDGNPLGTWWEHVGNKGKMKKNPPFIFFLLIFSSFSFIFSLFTCFLLFFYVLLFLHVSLLPTRSFFIFSLSVCSRIFFQCSSLSPCFLATRSVDICKSSLWSTFSNYKNLDSKQVSQMVRIMFMIKIYKLLKFFMIMFLKLQVLYH